MTRLLTADEAAQVLAVHVVTLRRWASADRVPAAVRVGARWRFQADRLAEPLRAVPGDDRPRPQRRRPEGVSASLDAALDRMVRGEL